MKNNEWPCGQNVRKCVVIILGALFMAVGCRDGEPLDFELGKWTVGAPSPSMGTEVGVAGLNGDIYLIGGFKKPVSDNAPVFISGSKKVEIYYPEQDRWEIKTSLPVGLHHVGVVALDERLYVVGGFATSSTDIWQPVNTLYRYEPKTDSWKELTSMPTARGALGVSVVQGKIYVISGFNGDTNPKVVEVYDPNTNAWSSVAPIPSPRDHMVAVTMGHRIYVIGGRIELDDQRNLEKVEVYDPELDKWDRVADLPTPRSGIAAAMLDGWIYVFGGEGGEGTFAENERYDPQTNVWRKMTPMPTPRHGLGAAAIRGRIYVLSGGPTRGFSYSNLTEIFSPPPLHSS